MKRQGPSRREQWDFSGLPKIASGDGEERGEGWFEKHGALRVEESKDNEGREE